MYHYLEITTFLLYHPIYYTFVRPIQKYVNLLILIFYFQKCVIYINDYSDGCPSVCPVCTVNIGLYIMYVSVDSRTSCTSILAEKNIFNSVVKIPFFQRKYIVKIPN